MSSRFVCFGQNSFNPDSRQVHFGKSFAQLCILTVHSPIFSRIFNSIVERTDRIAIELDASAKRETRRCRRWGFWLASRPQAPRARFFLRVR